MIKVKNKKIISFLSRKTLFANKNRNIIAISAIILTTLLFTSLFTIAMSINDGFQQSNFRQAGGFAHGTFKYLTKEQYQQLKDDTLIKEYGLRRFLKMPTDEPFNKSHVEIGYSDANYAHWTYCDPIEGDLPEENTNEAATDTKVLELKEKYRSEVLERWGDTHSFKGYEAAFLSQPKEGQRNQLERFLSVSKDTFEKLARFQNQSPACQEVQQIVKEWQQYISESFYKCDNQILLYLGQLYISDERFSNYINGFSSGNLASFFSEAINIFCAKDKT